MTDTGKLRLGTAQINWHVGNIEENLNKALDAITKHKSSNVDLVVFSELAISGYTPEDILLRSDFAKQVEWAIDELCKVTATLGISVLIGHPSYQYESLEQDSKPCQISNSLSLLSAGKIITTYHKRSLPNYGVFDEKRYFKSGDEPKVIEFNSFKLGLLICEDVWEAELVNELILNKPELVISVHGSPYVANKQTTRETMLQDYAKQYSTPFIYVNQVGGQDDLIFDGGSFTVDHSGEVIQRAPLFQEDHSVIEIKKLPSSTATHKENNLVIEANKLAGNNKPNIADRPSPLAEIYQALVLATHDYVKKNGFSGVTLGLSGGIDSALTLAIAVDALGKEQVQAVMMPFRYTADISIADAKEEAELLGVEFDIVSIEPMFDAFMGQLAPLFKDSAKDTTEENLQARCRAVILMALSNKKRRLVLTTSNKSEVAVGYSTLYGDMAGGFDVLKDVSKTLVYELSRYRNSLSHVIPNRVIERAPSAELAPDQTDQDNLPAYEVLDPLLEAYVEQDASVEKLLELGFVESDINRVVKLVNINQYKRSQAPIGPKISNRSFARERRYPVTSGFNPFLKHS